MKQYVIDEIRPQDHEAIKTYLKRNFVPSTVEGIYWIPLDQALFTKIQAEHVACQPLYFAVALEKNLIAFELLVRTKNKVRCECMGYATKEQRNWLMACADAMFERLNIKT
jgi:hypothetical protein